MHSAYKNQIIIFNLTAYIAQLDIRMTEKDIVLNKNFKIFVLMDIKLMVQEALFQSLFSNNQLREVKLRIF
jgi:hypothetical protein